MERGFVPFWRKSLDSRVFSNPELWHLWSYILLKARSEAGWVSVKTGRGNTEVWLDPGQMIFGRYAVAKKLKQKPSALYTHLKKLEKLGNCNTKNNTHFTIVTVINWSSYAEHVIPIATRKTTPKQHANNTKNHDNHDNHEDTFAQSLTKNGSEQLRGAPILSIPLIAKDGEFPIYQTDIEEWQSVYPGVEILVELKKIRLWNQDNPTKRKTKKGIRRHISSWLDRAQNGSKGTVRPLAEAQPYPYRELN